MNHLIEEVTKDLCALAGKSKTLIDAEIDSDDEISNTSPNSQSALGLNSKTAIQLPLFLRNFSEAMIN